MDAKYIRPLPSIRVLKLNRNPDPDFLPFSSTVKANPHATRLSRNRVIQIPLQDILAYLPSLRLCITFHRTRIAREKKKKMSQLLAHIKR